MSVWLIWVQNRGRELWGWRFLFLYNRPNFSHSLQVFSYRVVATLTHFLMRNTSTTPETVLQPLSTKRCHRTVHSEAALELLIVSHGLPQQAELSWKCRLKNLLQPAGENAHTLNVCVTMVTKWSLSSSSDGSSQFYRFYRNNSWWTYLLFCPQNVQPHIMVFISRWCFLSCHPLSRDRSFILGWHDDNLANFICWWWRP